MQYFIRKWANGRATLIAEDGYPLHTFDNVNEAIEACITECRVVPIAIEQGGQDLEAAPVTRATTGLKYYRWEDGIYILH